MIQVNSSIATSNTKHSPPIIADQWAAICSIILLSCTLCWKMCHTQSARYCRTKIPRGFSYHILPVDHFSEDDFLGSVTDAVHGSNPCHLVGCFQFLCHALRCLHLLDNQGQTLLRLLVQISRICPELTAENKVIKEDWMVLFDAVPVQLSSFTNGALFVRGQGKNRNIIIANEFIPKAIALIINVFLHLSHSIDLLILVLESQV